MSKGVILLDVQDWPIINFHSRPFSVAENSINLAAK
jgi:hypothetical protein